MASNRYMTTIGCKNCLNSRSSAARGRFLHVVVYIVSVCLLMCLFSHFLHVCLSTILLPFAMEGTTCLDKLIKVTFIFSPSITQPFSFLFLSVSLSITCSLPFIISSSLLLTLLLLFLSSYSFSFISILMLVSHSLSFIFPSFPL